MREIKFRAWEKPDTAVNFKGAMHQVVPNQLNSFFDFSLERPDEYVLMQYTGLKDKNGVEIYEGDVVNYASDKPSEIIFVDGAFSFADGPWSLADLLPEGTDKTEVIGNIWENKELLDERT